jgi:hypothetical protein
MGDYIKKSGDTMTGALTLSGAPTADAHAATKKYADDGDSATLAGAASDATTKADAAENNAKTYADTQIGAKVSKAGDEMTGDLVIKQKKIVVDETAPATQSYVIGKDGRIELYVDGELAVRF